MTTQIKQWGDSAVIILNKEFMKFHNLKVGNWVDISDMIRVKEKRAAGQTAPKKQKVPKVKRK